MQRFLLRSESKPESLASPCSSSQRQNTAVYGHVCSGHQECTNVNGHHNILWRLNACANSVNQAFPSHPRCIPGYEATLTLDPQPGRKSFLTPWPLSCIRESRVGRLQTLLDHWRDLLNISTLAFLFLSLQSSVCTPLALSSHPLWPAITTKRVTSASISKNAMAHSKNFQKRLRRIVSSYCTRVLMCHLVPRYVSCLGTIGSRISWSGDDRISTVRTKVLVWGQLDRASVKLPLQYGIVCICWRRTCIHNTRYSRPGLCRCEGIRIVWSSIRGQRERGSLYCQTTTRHIDKRESIRSRKISYP